ncbi:hypothetical protein GCM10010402_12070 [Actinomadura luteofluorescens]
MTSREYAAFPGDSLEAATAVWSRGGLAGELDLDQAVEVLRRRYPSLCIYWGEYTGSLWALLPDQPVEAKNAFDLARRIDAMLEHPRVRPVRDRRDQREVSASRAADGTWAMPERKAPSAPGQSRPADLATRRRRSSLLRRALVGCRRVLRGQPTVPSPAC